MNPLLRPRSTTIMHDQKKQEAFDAEEEERSARRTRQAAMVGEKALAKEPGLVYESEIVWWDERARKATVRVTRILKKDGELDEGQSRRVSFAKLYPIDEREEIGPY